MVVPCCVTKQNVESMVSELYTTVTMEGLPDRRATPGRGHKLMVTVRLVFALQLLFRGALLMSGLSLGRPSAALIRKYINISYGLRQHF